MSGLGKPHGCLLVAARDVIQLITGFSLNEMVFGHTLPGPISLLRDFVYLPIEIVNPVLDYRNEAS